MVSVCTKVRSVMENNVLLSIENLTVSYEKDVALQIESPILLRKAIELESLVPTVLARAH